MPVLFNMGVKAAERLATATRSGLITAAQFTNIEYLKDWVSRFKPGTGGAVPNTLIESTRNISVQANIGVHLASNLKLRQDESAWDHYDVAQPGQVIILRSAGGGNAIQLFDAPASANPATLTQRLSVAPSDFADCFLPPRARIRMAAQSIAHNTSTPIVFTTDDGLAAPGYIGTQMWDGSTKFIARRAGWYAFTGYGYFSNVAGGLHRELGISINGTGYVSHCDSANNHTASFFVPLTISSILYLNLNDFVQLTAYQDSGGAVNFNGALFSAFRISA